MNASFPYFSNHADAAGMGVYHTHPRCRVAQSIATSHRVTGTGDDRHECPFCFLLGQFQAYRSGETTRMSDPTNLAVANRNEAVPAPHSAHAR